MDCFAALAMTGGYSFAFSRHPVPELCIFVGPRENRPSLRSGFIDGFAPSLASLEYVITRMRG